MSNEFRMVVHWIRLILYVSMLGLIGPYLWQWFVVPFGLKPLTFWHAVGLATVISLFWSSNQDESKDFVDYFEMFKSLAFTLFGPLTIFCIGFVAKTFMVH